MAAANKGDVGLKEGLSRPYDVETITGDAKVVMNRRHQQGRRRGCSKTPIERPQRQRSKVSQESHQRPKIPNYPGSGMQAVFLDSWQNSPGTGVFFPRNGGKKFCSNIKFVSHVALVPLRVIEALNINGPTLGPKTSAQQEKSNNNGDEDDGDSHGGNEKSTQRCSSVFRDENTSPPETFLPKEWTY